MEKKVESPLKKFVVDKGGNPRGKQVTKEDLRQALRDISEWFKAHSKPYYTKLASFKPATEDDLKKLQTITGQQLPQSIIVLYGMYNGGLQLLDTFVTISVSQIEKEIAALKMNKKWKTNYVPIAKDIEGQYLCVEVNSGKETGMVVLSEDGVESLAESLGGYVESIRDSLLLKKLEYDEAMGLISVVDMK